jgi:hypothetical protein
VTSPGERGQPVDEQHVGQAPRLRQWSASGST